MSETTLPPSRIRDRALSHPLVRRSIGRLPPGALLLSVLTFASYVMGLLRLKPADSERIASVTAEVLAELDGTDRIYRRARMRLEGLDGALRKWNQAASGAHQDVLLGLRARMQQICVKIPAAEPAHDSCEAFLAGA